jgi:hypothetical protein
MKYRYDFPYVIKDQNPRQKKTRYNRRMKPILKGGALTSEERKRYIHLCFLLKEPDQNYESITLKLLEYLYKYILPMVSPEKKGLFDEIFSIKKMSLIDTNYLAIINLVSLQCAILLTDYSEHARKDPSFMLYISDPYNDPSNEHMDEEDDEEDEYIDFYDKTMNYLRKLPEDKLDELTDKRISELNEEEIDTYLEFYNVEDLHDIKQIIRKNKSKSKTTNNVFYTDIFNELLQCKWIDYAIFKQHILTSPLLLDRFAPLIFSNPHEKNEYTFPLQPNTNIFLAVILGEMTLSELLIASAKQIYFIGVVLTSTIADGYRYNPFLFFYHDIDHARGDINDRSAYNIKKMLTLNRKIIDFIKITNKKVMRGFIPEETYNNIMFWLFLLAHELPISIGLLLKKEESKIQVKNDLLHAALFPFGSRFPYLYRFTNEYDLGGFIPQQYRSNIFKIVEKHKQPSQLGNLCEDPNVPLFLRKSLDDFVKAWYFTPKIRKVSKRRSHSFSKSKAKLSTKKYRSI